MALPHEYFESPEYAELSPRAVKALLDIYCQFRGSNNGLLTASWGIMRARGWRSKSNLRNAVRELLDRGWLITTRRGGRHCATCFAVTFLGIDECGGALDITPSPYPLHLWRRSCSLRKNFFPTPPVFEGRPPAGQNCPTENTL
ncbi:MAG TPA: hypothetical protein VNK67_13375 [Burkholderiales bacterium]|nr:hypothetical protein [Burkholderiales bacterium]